jgi:hypothetical protein
LSFQPIPPLGFFPQLTLLRVEAEWQMVAIGGASTQDQRRARRVPFADRAVLQIGSTETPSKFVNFSERGCFVETRRWLPAGSQVQVSFASFGLVFRCNAIIRHRNEKGLGLEFIRLDPGTLAAFRALVNLTGGSA